MRAIPLRNSKKFALVDDQHYELAMQLNWFLTDDGYVRSTTLPRQVLHCWILGYSPTGNGWDHANGDKLDNRSDNLRPATSSQNGANRKVSSNNSSGYKGVDWNGGQWRVRLAVQGKRLYLGHYRDLAQAAEAYRKAAVQHFGEFARTS